MKKTVHLSLILFIFFAFIDKSNATSKFYLGGHVPGIYIYMDRINKKVYRQFREIYKEGTNELVYCVEPGATLSQGEYSDEVNYNSKFNIQADKWEKIKKIAYYGYRYQNHTDIKWYAITQYIIWKELMPSNWTMYFVDEHHNKIENMFKLEIDEIYNLVNNHKDRPALSDEYIFNYNDDIKITDVNMLLNRYQSSVGEIKSNILDLNNSLDVGEEAEIDLDYKYYKEPKFHYNENGQNILTRGDIFKDKLSISILITAGKVMINECDEESSESVFIGGTYEVLDEDDEVISEITCNKDRKCISDYIPVGSFKIRVKSLPEKYNQNEYIYDFNSKNNDLTIINVCSLKKEEPKKTTEIKKPITTPDKNEKNLNENLDEKTIKIPYTYKSRSLIYLLGIPASLLLWFIYVKFFK